MHVQCEQDETQKPEGKAENIDEGEGFILHQLAKGNFEVIK